MNIEPGTRVRSTEEEFFFLEEGTYVGKRGPFYEIRWDGLPERFVGPNLHTEDEFEVIDE